MEFIYNVFYFFFKRKETLLEKLCKELKITQDELSKLLKVELLIVYQWSKGKYSNVIKDLLECLLLNHKDIEKKELCIKAIQKVVLLESIDL